MAWRHRHHHGTTWQDERLQARLQAGNEARPDVAGVHDEVPQRRQAAGRQVLRQLLLLAHIAPQARAPRTHTPSCPRCAPPARHLRARLFQLLRVGAVVALQQTPAAQLHRLHRRVTLRSASSAKQDIAAVRLRRSPKLGRHVCCNTPGSAPALLHDVSTWMPATTSGIMSYLFCMMSYGVTTEHSAQPHCG